MEIVNNKKIQRKAMKKFQRKRRRQKRAKERDRVAAEERMQKLDDPMYSEWIKKQEDQALEAENQRKSADEAAWLMSEQWQEHLCCLARQRQEADQEAQREKRTQQENENKRCEEERLHFEVKQKGQAEEAAALFDKTMNRMHDFLETTNVTALPLPAELHQSVHSHPNVKFCEFFERTNCCRYAEKCVFNHRRPLLSRILIIRNFFSHQSPPLTRMVKRAKLNGEHPQHTSDNVILKFVEFFDDVIIELETFGVILKFATTQNLQRHLHGHVFVEYKEEKYISFLNRNIVIGGRTE